MNDQRDIRFRFAPAKALSAIHWMVAEQPGIDLHTMLKSCYFADKAQFNLHDQPIFGATYRAMRFGPVPLEIYEMAKGEPLWLAELGLDAFPWRLQGFHLVLVGNDEPDMSVFAESEVEALRRALALSSGLTFTGRTALTHGRDWQAAGLGRMRYEDMFEPGSRTEDEIEHVRGRPLSSSYSDGRMSLRTLDVVWIFDEFIKPPGPKMIVCVHPDEGWFFRINTEDKWPVPVLLRLADCPGFLRHDSYLECGSPLEFGDYIIEESIAGQGVIGRLPARYAQLICAALDKSFKIAKADRAMIRQALSC